MVKMDEDKYKKHFLALESEPSLFTQLAHKLGAPASLVFREILSLDEPELLPRAAYAFVFVFPTTKVYEDRRSEEDAAYKYSCDKNDDIVWFQQKINNACGLYGVLHSLCNGPARRLLESGSLLQLVLERCSTREELAEAIENSDDIESIYHDLALQGSSKVPEDAEAEVDYHYTCFVRSCKNDHVYEIDGDRKGPIDRGSIVDSREDVLDSGVLALIREHISQENDGIAYNLMALVEES